jgi:[ribosomal protein S18]-alanine N-acetyltransferase
VKIRKYTPSDFEGCMAVFDSNLPLYFDHSERPQFVTWLEHCGNNALEYKSPTYSNAEFDSYEVVEDETEKIVGCGGYYICKDLSEARMAWGMIHSGYHGKGIGTLLFQSREEELSIKYPKHIITLGTSQHTFRFYERMGMCVLDIIKSGYGAEIDQYNMQMKFK